MVTGPDGIDPRTVATLPLSQVDASAPGGHLLLVVHAGRVLLRPLPETGRVVLGRSPEVDLTIDDPGLSRRHACIEVRGGNPFIEDLGSRNGTFLGGTRLTAHTAAPLANVPVTLGTTRLILQGGTEPDAAGPRGAAFALVRRMAATDLNVLLTGEAATGKRTAAGLLHQGSGRVTAPLWAHDCTAGPLHPARIPAGGTVLLTSMESLDALAQVRLAEVLRSADDVRVLGCWTETPGTELPREPSLIDWVGEVRVHLPPVRALGEELGPVATELVRGYCLETLGLRQAPVLAPETVALLRGHPWPGNFGELIPVLQRAAVDGDGRTVAPADLSLTAVDHLSDDERREKRRILAALDACVGNQTRAADRLKISRGTLVSRLEKYGIRRPRKKR